MKQSKKTIGRMARLGVAVSAVGLVAASGTIADAAEVTTGSTSDRKSVV